MLSISVGAVVTPRTRCRRFLSRHVTSVHYINLDDRPDRLEIINPSLEVLGETKRAQRFAAIRATPGFMGCTQSHIGVLDRYIASNPTTGFVAIFEDDWKFVGTPAQRDLVLTALEWDRLNVLLLSMNPVEVEPTATPGIVQVHKAMCCSGYLVRHNYAPVIRACFQTALDTKQPIDIEWFKLQANGGFYALSPPLGIQAPSYSDIVNREVEYGL